MARKERIAAFLHQLDHAAQLSETEFTVLSASSMGGRRRKRMNASCRNDGAVRCARPNGSCQNKGRCSGNNYDTCLNTK